MIIILTGGTQNSRNEIISQLKNYLTFDVLDQNLFKEQKSYVEHNIKNDKSILLTRCFLKSQRYEIFCIARRFNKNFIIIFDYTPCEENFFEEPCGKYDQPTIGSNELHKITELKSIQFNRKTHVKKNTATSDYLLKVNELIEKINKEYEYSFHFLKECENKVLKMINMHPIELNRFEDCYRKIIEQEINKHK